LCARSQGGRRSPPALCHVGRPPRSEDSLKWRSELETRLSESQTERTCEGLQDRRGGDFWLAALRSRLRPENVLGVLLWLGLLVVLLRFAVA